MIIAIIKAYNFFHAANGVRNDCEFMPVHLTP